MKKFVVRVNERVTYLVPVIAESPSAAREAALIRVRDQPLSKALWQDGTGPYQTDPPVWEGEADEEPDLASSASRQHYIETGKYLTEGEEL